jgi:hypothetical protein
MQETQDSQTSTVENVNGMNSAIKYHIETAATDIQKAIKGATAETIYLFKDHVEYNQLTIQNAIAMSKENNFTEVGNKLTKLNDRLTAVFSDTVSNQQKIDEINSVINDLKALVKP